MVQKNMASDEFMMPHDIVSELLSEMVEVTSKHFEECNSDFPDSEINNSPKQESSGSEINCDSKDLPVRRSTRIKHLVVQQDKGVKKKNGTKPNKSIKNSESKPSEENSQLPLDEERIQIDVVSSKSGDEISNSKNEVLSESQKTSKCEGVKGPKVNKRAQKRVSSKSEKEDTKSEKAKTDKKKPARKKKILTESVESSIDKVIEDVINASLICEDSDIKSEISPVSNTTPCSVVVDNLKSEIQVPEISNNSTKQSDNQNQDLKDKQSENNSLKPVKVKSRWWQSSKLEGVLSAETTNSAESTAIAQQLSIIESTTPLLTSESKVDSKDQNNLIPLENCIEVMDTVISTTEKPAYEHIEENIYRFERKKSKSKKQVRRMVCDCTLTKEEIERGMLGCKEECLNRLLMIECGYRCALGDFCSNKRFQKKQYPKTEILKTEKKGWGLRALEDVSTGDFLMEFVGEVLNHKEYRQRVKLYAKEKNVHCYFMALKTDEILDATCKGNYTRFINHSCDPNCETQKWTVNGELRVGVFVRRPIFVGEEFTLDYKFQRYGREAQKCFCGSANCSGYIGGEKQISIDAYSGAKSSSSKRKKGTDDKKREWEDLAVRKNTVLYLEEEIEKLNSVKGLRNREETLKFARLMVRAEESSSRHQLLDIVIKTEEQACLRLFLDYHGLPLLWSWMTDTVELDLKMKILQVLALLPVSNKTMLLDSKVMNIVEKWVEEFAADKQEISDIKSLQSSVASQSDENSEPVCKKLKNVEISDSETDSNGSHNTNENPPETSTLNENFKVEILKNEMSPSEPVTEIKSPSELQDSKTELKEDDPQYELKKSILSKGADLLNNWKNLKEVFRIPRLEQQKRKEDELEADHHMMSVCAKTEEKKPEVVEVTGSQIQVLISGKTPFSDDMRNFEYDSPDMNYKMDDRSRNNLLQVPQTNNIMKKRPFIHKPKMEDLSQRKLKEDSDSSLESASPSLSVTSPIMQPTNRPPLLPTPGFMNQPPVNFPPPINPSVVPHLDQAPPTMYPPPIVYPPSQVPFVNTGAPPPVLTHPPTSIPPPTAVIPQPAPILQHPPNTSIPPVNAGLPPNAFQLPPPSVPASAPFIPSQNSAVPNYPPGPNPFGNQGQPFYFMQQPPAIPNTPQPENMGVQSAPPMSVQPVNPMQMQPTSYPLPSTTSLPPTSLPMQVPTSLPPQVVVPVQTAVVQPTESVSNSATPAVQEEPKPVKLPKLWRSATDSEGNVYYYHSVTRITQWDPPSNDEAEDESEDEDEDSESEESESSDTPTYDEPKVSNKHVKRKPKKRKTTKAAADTSVSITVKPEVAKKIKELFRTKMSSYIVHCLNAYRKPDCKVGRITSNEDFKYLARKLTHYTMTKELKQCKNVEDLDCNECVMHKAKDFIKKYMSKYGSKYSRKEKYSPPDV